MSTMYLEQDSKTKTRIVKIAHVLRKNFFFSFSLCQENPESNASALLVSIFHVISIVEVSMSIAVQDIVLSFDSVDGIVAI